MDPESEQRLAAALLPFWGVSGTVVGGRSGQGDGAPGVGLQAAPVAASGPGRHPLPVEFVEQEQSFRKKCVEQ